MREAPRCSGGASAPRSTTTTRRWHASPTWCATRRTAWARSTASGSPRPAPSRPRPGCCATRTRRGSTARPLLDDLVERLGRPVRIENDANCFALSEAVDGAGAGHRVVFGVILGTGVGAGITVDGTVLCGPNHIAGRMGAQSASLVGGRRSGPGRPAIAASAAASRRFSPGPGCARDHRAATGVERSAEEIAAAAERGRRRRAMRRSSATSTGWRARSRTSSTSSIPMRSCLAAACRTSPRWYERVPQLWSRWVFADR